jgi:hypothetical protein
MHPSLTIPAFNDAASTSLLQKNADYTDKLQAVAI